MEHLKNLWDKIDRVASFGLSSKCSSLRISRQLQSVHKATARATGLHGFISGKGKLYPNDNLGEVATQEGEALNKEALGIIRRRIAAKDYTKERLGSRLAKDDGLLKRYR